MNLIFIFISSLSYGANYCPLTAACPTTSEFKLSKDTVHLPDVNLILSQLSECRDTATSVVVKKVEKRIACASSLFSCISEKAKAVGTAVFEASVAPGKAFGECTKSIVACASGVAHGVRQVPTVLSNAWETLQYLPLEKRRAAMCSLAGHLGPSAVISMATGYGTVKLAPEIMALLESLPSLKGLLASAKFSVENIKGLFSLDDANKTKALLLQKQGREDIVDKVISSCMVPVK